MRCGVIDHPIMSAPSAPIEIRLTVYVETEDNPSFEMEHIDGSPADRLNHRVWERQAGMMNAHFRDLIDPYLHRVIEFTYGHPSVFDLSCFLTGFLSAHDAGKAVVADPEATLAPLRRAKAAYDAKLVPCPEEAKRGSVEYHRWKDSNRPWFDGRAYTTLLEQSKIDELKRLLLIHSPWFDERTRILWNLFPQAWPPNGEGGETVPPHPLAHPRKSDQTLDKLDYPGCASYPGSMIRYPLTESGQIWTPEMTFFSFVDSLMGREEFDNGSLISNALFQFASKTRDWPAKAWQTLRERVVSCEHCWGTTNTQLAIDILCPFYAPHHIDGTPSIYTRDRAAEQEEPGHLQILFLHAATKR